MTSDLNFLPEEHFRHACAWLCTINVIKQHRVDFYLQLRLAKCALLRLKWQIWQQSMPVCLENYALSIDTNIFCSSGRNGGNTYHWFFFFNSSQAEFSRPTLKGQLLPIIDLFYYLFFTNYNYIYIKKNSIINGTHIKRLVLSQVSSYSGYYTVNYC